MRDGLTQDGKRHVDWLAKEPAGARPIYCQEHYDDIPASVRWPRQEINEWFRNLNGDPLPMGFYADDYWTSTPAQMLGHAIYEGFKEIHLYGVDMLQAEEYCVGPETLVLTADLRWIPAGDLKMGDVLIGFDEDTPKQYSLRRWLPTTVEVVQRLRRPGRRIHLEDGRTIMCSAEHRWLVRSGNAIVWRTTDELVYPGHRRYLRGRPSRLMKLIDTWTEDRSWDAGYVAASVDGEGHLGQTVHRESGGVFMQVGFAQRENAMAREFEAALSRLDYDFSKRQTSVAKSVNAYQLRGGRTEALRFLGSIRPRRLLDQFKVGALGFMKIHGVDDDAVPVAYVEDIGEQEVVGLRTSTGTFIADGFATHNSYQRSGCEYYSGVCRGRGIKLYIPPTSALCKAGYVYGFTEPPTDIQHLQPYVDHLNAKVGESQINKDKAASAAATIDGGLQMCRLLLSLVENGAPDRDAELRPIMVDGKTVPHPCTMQDLVQEMKRQLVVLEPKQREALNTIVAMDGQMAGFRCSSAWAEHYARGGTLQ